MCEECLEKRFRCHVENFNI